MWVARTNLAQTQACSSASSSRSDIIQAVRESERHANRRRSMHHGEARYAVGPASQSRYPRAGSDGRTNPLRHRRLFTDFPSRAATYQQPSGRRNNRVLIPGAELWQSDISERICADLYDYVGVCIRAQVTALPLED
jgi:hypothetical protein